jgi:hypothetical protein
MENFRAMTKDTFHLKQDPQTHLFYVIRAQDEQSKNHKESDRPIVTGIMPELPHDYKMCPVRSYQEYLSKLHPDCNDLWQQPNDKVKLDNKTWYCNAPRGSRKLSSFMTDLRKEMGYQTKYTNHSIRVTGNPLREYAANLKKSQAFHHFRAMRITPIGTRLN